MRKYGPHASRIKPSTADCAYAAGFFDGEGNVVIALNWKGGQRMKYPVYNMRVGAAQKESDTLFWLRDRWGGSVRPSHQQRHHRWGCFSRGALKFLTDVLPYLQIKRKRALLAISYQAAITQHGRKGRTSKYIRSLAALKAKMNRLNASRGPKAMA